MVKLKHSSAVVDELFEFVWPFCGVGALKGQAEAQGFFFCFGVVSTLAKVYWDK